MPEVGDDFFRDRSGATECVQDPDSLYCPSWVIENFDRFTTPLLEHVVLVAVSVVLGFVIAFALAVLSNGRRWLVPPLIGFTGALYTIPSLAFFFLLIPITGRGADTAIIALTAYTLQIIYRNIVAGLANVPGETRDAGRGMGLTNRQLFWKVELPLALPEIVAGLRVATVSTVALATLAVFAGGGGLGSEIIAGSNIVFSTSVITAGALAIGLAIAMDALLLLFQRRALPWRQVRPV